MSLLFFINSSEKKLISIVYEGSEINLLILSSDKILLILEMSFYVSNILNIS